MMVSPYPKKGDGSKPAFKRYHLGPLFASILERTWLLMAKILPKARYRAVSYFRHWRTGKLIFAANYGKKCFWIPVKR